MKVHLYLLVVALVASGLYIYKTEKSEARCARIAKDLERLECFDKLKVSDHRTGVKNNSVIGNGKWVRNEHIDPFDDAKTIWVTLEASRIEDADSYEFASLNILGVRCMNNQTDVYIDWHGGVRGWNPEKQSRNLKTVDLHIRVGEKPAVTSTWRRTKEDRSVLFHAQPVEFAKELLEADSFVIRLKYPDQYDGKKTVIFKTQGLRNAIQPLRELCGW